MTRKADIFRRTVIRLSKIRLSKIRLSKIRLSKIRFKYSLKERRQRPEPVGGSNSGRMSDQLRVARSGTNELGTSE